MRLTFFARARRHVAAVIAVVVIATLITLGVGSSADAAVLDEAESNDTYATANTLPLGATMRGVSVSEGTRDSDYYAIEVPDNGRVTLDLRFPEGLSGQYAYRVEIRRPGARDPDFTWAVATADSSGTKLRDQAVFLPQGEYMVVVAGAAELSTWGQPYTLTVDSAPGTVETESNQSMAVADVLPLGTTISGSTLSAVPIDEDWYALDIPQDSRVVLDLRFRSGLGDGRAYHVDVMDSADGVVTYAWDIDAAASDGAALREQAVFLHAGRHFLSITGREEWPTWGEEYWLTVTATAGVVEVETNHDASHATALPLGVTVSGSSLTGGASDQDWFAIDMPKAGAAEIDLSYAAASGSENGIAHVVGVHSADGAVISEFELDDSQADGAYMRSKPVPLPAGRAYIRVYGDRAWPSWAKAYALTARLVPAPTSTVTRLSGADRYQTSAAISKASFESGVPVVYVASGVDFPDALSGAPVAGRSTAPVLLVAPNAIPDAVRTELQRLKPGRIVVLGGTGAVSSRVATQLDALTAGAVTRLAGADRYATSAAISKATFAAGAPKVYIASGQSFPDALSGAPAAGMNDGPVLLVQPGTIPATVREELTRLRPAEIVILGGNRAVSPTLEPLLLKFSSSVSRLPGADRYATSAEISRASFPAKAQVAYISSGMDFPDALSGAPVAAMYSGPVLLTSTTSIPDAVKTELLRLKPERIVILGGTGVVSANVQAQLAQYAIP